MGISPSVLPSKLEIVRLPLILLMPTRQERDQFRFLHFDLYHSTEGTKQKQSGFWERSHKIEVRDYDRDKLGILFEKERDGRRVILIV